MAIVAPSADLPLSETLAPADAQEVAATVRDAYETDTPIYPLGGGASLDMGLPATAPGLGLSLSGMNRILDFPARDMTVTVEAGVTLANLTETLAAEGLRLPIDAPLAEQATVGGLVATNWSGPRRCGHGTVRDYVIGIHAVDGRGTQFKGGGRVVKNVAGYDFCKLLTGSLGTLGVITQLTFKLKPLAAASTFVACRLPDAETAQRLLGNLVQSQTNPVAIELLAGPVWEELPPLAELRGPAGTTDGDFGLLLVGYEGPLVEVDWQRGRMVEEWKADGIRQPCIFTTEQAESIWQALTDFPSPWPGGEPAPLVLKANMVSSGTVEFLAAARAVDPGCSIQAHAASGSIIVQFTEVPAEGLSRALTGGLRPIAMQHHGDVIVLSHRGGGEMTRQAVWGGLESPYWLMEEVKRQFDPKNLLNPGRFVYP